MIFQLQSCLPLRIWITGRTICFSFWEMIFINSQNVIDDWYNHKWKVLKIKALILVCQNCCWKVLLRFVATFIFVSFMSFVYFQAKKLPNFAQLFGYLCLLEAGSFYYFAKPKSTANLIPVYKPDSSHSSSTKSLYKPSGRHVHKAFFLQISSFRSASSISNKFVSIHLKLQLLQ